MGSTYRLICAAHRPGLVLDQDYGTADEALAALAGPVGTVEHPHCDLVLGRWSGGLVEIGCPSMTADALPRTATHGSWHRDTRWLDVAWLRLLAMVTSSEASAARLPSCWTSFRAEALARHL